MVVEGVEPQEHRPLVVQREVELLERLPLVRAEAPPEHEVQLPERLPLVQAEAPPEHAVEQPVRLQQASRPLVQAEPPQTLEVELPVRRADAGRAPAVALPPRLLLALRLQHLGTPAPASRIARFPISLGRRSS